VVERNQWVNWLCFNLSLNFGHIANRSEPPTVGETFLAWICLLRRQQSQIVHQWRCASLSVLIAEIYDEYREVLHSCIRFLSGHSESVEDVAARYALILLSIHGNSFLSRVDSLRLVSLQHVVAILLRAASKLVRQFVCATSPDDLFCCADQCGCVCCECYPESTVLTAGTPRGQPTEPNHRRQQLRTCLNHLCCRKGTALSRAGDVYRPQQNLQQQNPHRRHSGSLIMTASPRGHELPNHSTQQPKYSLEHQQSASYENRTRNNSPF
jgi:hypothetical protein